MRFIFIILLASYTIGFSQNTFNINEVTTKNLQKDIIEQDFQTVCSQINPSNSFENGVGFDIGSGYTCANDIIVAAGEDVTLNQIIFTRFSLPGVTIDFAEISIYNDNEGLPGIMLSTQIVVATTQMYTGACFGFDLIIETYDITPVLLTGNLTTETTYWVAIQVTTDDGSGAYWEDTSATTIGNLVAFNDGSGWETVPTYDGVYTFAGDCEPITNISEDFNSGLPPNWYSVINTGDCDWQNGVDLPIGDDFITPGIFFDDHNCGENADPSNVSIYTEVYNLEEASSATINYDIAFQEEGNQTFTVEVFDGSIWQEIAFYEDDLIPNIQTESIDVSAYVNANFQVRWVYDDNGGEMGWHGGIDNFFIDYFLDTNDNLIESVSFYPNPVNSILNIEIQEQITGIQVFNLLGEVIFAKEENTDQIDFSNYSKGIYFVKVETDKGFVVKKVIKQ